MAQRTLQYKSDCSRWMPRSIAGPARAYWLQKSCHEVLLIEQSP